MNELDPILNLLGAGADAATIAIGAMLLRHHTRLVKIETVLIMAAKRLGIDSTALKP